MVHRLDLPRRGLRRPLSTPARQQESGTEESTAPARPVLVASTILIGVSLLLMTLSAVGAAGLLPAGVRTVLVCLVALTLPGLPVAALLRLPRNGIFGSVTVATSVAVNIVLAQLNTVAELRQLYLVQIVILGLSAAAVVALARREPAAPDSAGSWSATLITGISRRRFELAVLVVVAVLFTTAVLRLNVDAAGRFGLIAILGVDYFVGLGLIAALLVVGYRRAVFDPVTTAAANVALIVYTTMPVAWATGTAPFPTAFAHRYITNWIADLGALPPPVDARMSWAGFFSAGAHLMQISGLPDSEAFLTSASLVFSILMIYPVYAIGMAIADNSRVAWLGVTVYVLFNWYQQDYFAPQAVAMQFYATILAVLLWQLRRSELPALAGRWGSWRRIPGRVPGRDARWTLAVEALLLIIVAALVVSHQLTPLVVILALALFAVLGLTRHKLLWLAATLMFIAWFHYGAYGYWHGHLLDVLADIGGLDGNLTSGVSSRITGDPVYLQMQYLRMAASMLLFAVALYGCFRLRHSKFGLIAVALILAPLSLVLVQSYGGEVVIRSFLYASPVMAPLAAAVVLPLLTSRRTPVVLGCAAVFALAVLLTTNRGLNTSFEQTPRETLTVSTQMQQLTDPGRLAYWGQGLTFNMPRLFDIDDDCYANPQLLADCTVEQDIDYIVETQSDAKYMEYRFGLGAPQIDELIEILTTEKGFAVMYEGDSVQVLRRGDAPALELVTGR